MKVSDILIVADGLEHARNYLWKLHYESHEKGRDDAEGVQNATCEDAVAWRRLDTSLKHFEDLDLVGELRGPNQ